MPGGRIRPAGKRKKKKEGDGNEVGVSQRHPNPTIVKVLIITHFPKNGQKITAMDVPERFSYSSMYLSNAAFKIAFTVSPRSLAFCFTSSAYSFLTFTPSTVMCSAMYLLFAFRFAFETMQRERPGIECKVDISKKSWEK